MHTFPARLLRRCSCKPLDIEYGRFERIDTEISFLGRIDRIDTDIRANIPQDRALQYRIDPLQGSLLLVQERSQPIT